MKTETQRQNKMRETIQRKLRSVEDGKSDIEQQRETLKGQITGLERGESIANKNFKTIPGSIGQYELKKLMKQDT